DAPATDCSETVALVLRRLSLLPREHLKDTAGPRAPLTASGMAKGPANRGLQAVACYGRYWARTSDLRLVEAALSQLS
ncbi:MAG: hypothetical protein JWL67_1643, partial [Solirubrobacterales bacterium]|nr:hypothetical protein [Solirubrobacterales bacterium]